MKFTYFFICLSVLVANRAYGQDLTVAGISGAVLWGRAEVNNDGIILFHVNSPANSFEVCPPVGTAGDASRFNFNPSIVFSGLPAALQLPIAGCDLRQMTVFTVYWPNDSLTEKSVWYLERNSHNLLMMTSSRLADLESISFMNFIGRPQNRATISLYEQFKGPDTIPTVRQAFFFGAKPPTPDVPVAPFSGSLAEIIVFDRVLPVSEQQIVSTYLAFKYGISLEPLTTALYKTADGTVLHNGKESRPYVWRVAGIGNTGSWIQKQSASSADDGLLAMGFDTLAVSNSANPASISTTGFLSWADDNSPLRLTESIAGLPPLLSRKWRISAVGDACASRTALQFNTRRTDWNWLNGNTWWLMIDRSGSGRFPPGEVSFYPASAPDNEGKISVNNVLWDTDRSGADVFTFCTAPAFFAAGFINPPKCQPVEPGSLIVDVLGGSAPYELLLVNLDHGTEHRLAVSSGTAITFSELTAAWYSMRVVDASGHAYLDTFYVQSADAPLVAIDRQYELKQGRTIHLDACTGVTPCNQCRFTWQGPNGLSVYGPEIYIEHPGQYMLEVIRDQCKSVQTISVTGVSDPFRQMLLFPNPATDGIFSVMLDLWHVSPVDISIVDTEGRLVAERRLNGSDRYLTDFQISVPPGAYQFIAATQEGTRTLSFIVNRSARR